MSIEAQARGAPARVTQWALPFLLCLTLIEALVLLVPGHLAVSAHEVDVLHAAGAVMRLVAGEQQYIDFLTPLGPLAFYPVAWFVEAGLSLPRAFLAVNVLVALLLLPAVIRITQSRLPGPLGLAFGAYIVILATAVVYGGDQANISISMAYNRWAWAVASVIVLLIFVAPLERTERPVVDAAIIGLGLACLALVKITFFVAFAPIVVVAYALNRDWKGLAAVALSGLTIALLATILFGGIAFWSAYLDNLLSVRAFEVRPHPGLELQSLLAAPRYFPTIVCLLLLVVTLRMSGQDGPGLLALLMLPAFVFVTFQNWGNDPKWVITIGFLALALRDKIADRLVLGAPAGQMLTITAVAAFTIGAPPVLNMAVSPFRNAVASGEDYVSMLADPRHFGLWVERKRSFDPEGTQPLAAAPDPQAEPGDEMTTAYQLGEVEIGRCVMTTGYFGTIKKIADRLAAAGHTGTRVLLVDVTNPLPLIGDFKFVSGEAPWYYGGASGASDADAIVVPTCSTSHNTSERYIGSLNEMGGWRLAERDAYYLLFVKG